MLNRFRESIDKILTKNFELPELLTLLRDNLKRSVSMDDFRLSCIEQMLNSIYTSNNEGKPWSAPDLIKNNELNYSVRVIFWPMFYENNPHQHKTWSVTGIFHNDLNIHTYTLLDEPGRLK